MKIFQPLKFIFNRKERRKDKINPTSAKVQFASAISFFCNGLEIYCQVHIMRNVYNERTIVQLLKKVYIGKKVLMYDVYLPISKAGKSSIF